MPLRGRFAPSPSGRMHLGNVFCALISWLSVKSEGGEAVLRIEDIDTTRCRKEYAEQLLNDLAYLGLDFDDGPYYQSERTELYEQALAQLTAQNLIYPCYCSRDELHVASAPHTADGRVLYAGTCRTLSDEQRAAKTRKPSLRMKSSDITYSWYDGHYAYQSANVQAEWGDFVLRRSDELFAYQLAVVVDDAAMGITHVVRGRDLLTSVAPQLQLYDALGFTPPQFAHIPLLVSTDGRRLSKRDRDLHMGELRDRFSSPETLIGKLLFLCGMIDSPKPLSAHEAIAVFSWDRLPKNDIVVDVSSFLSV